MKIRFLAAREGEDENRKKTDKKTTGARGTPAKKKHSWMRRNVNEKKNSSGSQDIAT